MAFIFGLLLLCVINGKLHTPQILILNPHPLQQTSRISKDLRDVSFLQELMVPALLEAEQLHLTRAPTWPCYKSEVA